MIQISLASGGKKVIKTSRLQRCAIEKKLKPTNGLKGSCSNTIMKKGGNTYIRPFVRIDTMY